MDNSQNYLDIPSLCKIKRCASILALFCTIWLMEVDKSSLELPNISSPDSKNEIPIGVLFLVHPFMGCTHPIEQSSYQTTLERWKWFFSFPISFQPIKFKIHFCGRQTCKPLANAMTEYISVVAVVDFYWSDSMNSMILWMVRFYVLPCCMGMCYLSECLSFWPDLGSIQVPLTP